MTEYDRKFCSNTNCKDKNCKRNQNNFEFFQRYISISDFPECEKFPEYRLENVKGADNI